LFITIYKPSATFISPNAYVYEIYKYRQYVLTIFVVVLESGRQQSSINV